MYQSETAPWLEFYAWNTDGSAKTDLVYNTSGISIVVVRDNLANSSALTLSAASGPTDWAAGKFWAMGGNKYRVGIATASISSFTGQISVEGSYTGGVLTGVTREVSAYNPTRNPSIAGDAMTLTSGQRVKLDATQSDYAPLLASGYTAPANSTIASIYAIVQLIDSDVSTMPADVRDAILNRVLETNHETAGSVGVLLQYLDALISSRLAPATPGRTLAVSSAGAVELDSSITTQLDAIETDAAASVGYLTTLVSRLTANAATAIQNLYHMITGTGASSKYTVAALENAPSGGGGGDATLANQELILDRLSETTIGVTGYAQLDIYGVLQLKRGHTATLTFTSDTNNIVSDLSAGTTKVFFGVKDAAGRSWLSIEGTKLVNTGLQSVRFTISAALAAAMINGEHFFDVVAVYGYNASNTPKYTSLEPFTSGRAKVTDLYVDI